MVKGSALSVVDNQITLNPAMGEDTAANVVKNITQVEITNPAGEVIPYMPAQTGKVNHYVATLFDETGKFQTEAEYNYVEATVSGKKATYKVVSTGAIFEAEGTYSINVTATGYDNLVFQYEKKEPVKEDNTDIAGTKATIKGITYKVVKNNKGVYSATVTGAKNKNIKTITIPATVKIENETLKVTVINKNAIKNCKKATKLVIGKNITTIGKQAFYGNKALKNISIKSTKIASIGKKAFANGNKKAKVTVAAAKKKAYKKMLKNAGFEGSVK